MAKAPGYIVIKDHGTKWSEDAKPLTDGVDVILFAEREDALPYITSEFDKILRLVKFRKPRTKKEHK